MRWESRPAAAPPDAALPLPTLGVAVRRGLANRCPVCGEGKVFAGYLRVVPACAVCHAPLGRLRADDAPPYIVILLVGHLLLPLVLWVEKTYEPPMWLHMVVWLPLFTVLCIALLRPVKGGVVGWMTTLGFAAGEDEEDDEHARTAPRAAAAAASPPRPGPSHDA